MKTSCLGTIQYKSADRNIFCAADAQPAAGAAHQRSAVRAHKAVTADLKIHVFFLEIKYYSAQYVVFLSYDIQWAALL